MDNNTYYTYFFLNDVNDTSRDISSWKYRNVLFCKLALDKRQAQNRKTELKLIKT